MKVCEISFYWVRELAEINYEAELLSGEDESEAKVMLNADAIWLSL